MQQREGVTSPVGSGVTREPQEHGAGAGICRHSGEGVRAFFYNKTRGRSREVISPINPRVLKSLISINVQV